MGNAACADGGAGKPAGHIVGYSVRGSIPCLLIDSTGELLRGANIGFSFSVPVAVVVAEATDGGDASADCKENLKYKLYNLIDKCYLFTKLTGL